jgi:hypothetical protein
MPEKSYRNSKKKKLGLQINQMLKDKPKKHEFVFKKTNDLVSYTTMQVKYFFLTLKNY